MMVDCQNETSIVTLSIQEAAIGRQISVAETRAESRCPVYDPKNNFWKRVDTLIEKQENVMERISKFTSENDTDKIISPKIRSAAEINLDKDNHSDSSDTDHDSSKKQVS